MNNIFNKTAWPKILKHKDKSDPNIKIDLQIFYVSTQISSCSLPSLEYLAFREHRKNIYTEPLQMTEIKQNLTAD